MHEDIIKSNPSVDYHVELKVVIREGTTLYNILYYSSVFRINEEDMTLVQLKILHKTFLYTSQTSKQVH